ncbi:MAG: TIM barrel protein [Planctomycetaceae bacterium]|nr:TIM barrel protein [Planctomycetaceae bacterium]
MSAIPSVSRRSFLKAGSAAVGAAWTAGFAFAAEGSDPYGGFKMGLQSYSLRGYEVETALEHTRTLGLKFWEAYPKHLPLSTVPAEVTKQKEMLAKYSVTLLAYGVIHFDTDETAARRMFDFAHAIGLTSISANPKKEAATFDLLDKLVDEYKIPIAIHNHGPKADYDKISDVEEWTKDRHPLIGACVDTGHFLRSDENPVDAIERLGKRVFGCHLKDVRSVAGDGDNPAKKIMTVLGEGDLDVAGCLRALKKHGYDRCLSLEYEENAQNPLSDIETCLAHVRKAVQELA